MFKFGKINTINKTLLTLLVVFILSGLLPSCTYAVTPAPASRTGAQDLSKIDETTLFQQGVGVLAKVSGLEAAQNLLGKQLAKMADSVVLQLQTMVNDFLKMIVDFIFWVAKWLLIVTSVTLNMTINLTIINFAKVIQSVPAITDAWKAIRDIINIFLVFSLLYASIRVILGGLSSQQKNIRNIIIVAVSINFSFMVTSIAIDASNILTIQFYDVIPGIENSGGDSSLSGAGDALDNGLANTVVSLLKLSTINTLDTTYHEDQVKNQESTGGAAGAYVGVGLNYLVAIIMAAIILFTVGAIFIMITVILLVRFITLIILLITSPVGFAQSALPNIKIGGDWTQSLVSNLMFPPIFFALLWISLTILSGLSSGIGSGSDWSKLLFLGDASGETGDFFGAGLGGAIEIFLNYFIVLAMLVASVLIAKSSGIKGAQTAISAGGKVSFGGGAFLARNTVGRGAQAFSGVAKNLAGSNNRLVSAAGRMAYRGSTAVAGSSFDARGIKGVSGAGFGNVGKDQSGGFAGVRAARVKRIEKQNEELGKLTYTEEKKLMEATEKQASVKEHKELYEQVLGGKVDINSDTEAKQKLQDRQAELEEKQKTNTLRSKDEAIELAALNKTLSGKKLGKDERTEALESLEQTFKDVGNDVKEAKGVGGARQEQQVKALQSFWGIPGTGGYRGTNRAAAVKLRQASAGGKLKTKQDKLLKDLGDLVGGDATPPPPPTPPPAPTS